jgi:hypothetical protein
MTFKSLSGFTGFGLSDGAHLTHIVFSVRPQRVSGYLDRRHAVFWLVRDR